MSLPVLECMMPSGRASAQGVPRRYAILFAGQALGGDNYPKDRSRVDGLLGTVAGDDTLMCVSSAPDGAVLAGHLRDLAGLDR